MKKNVELLAPAGDGDALRGAINAGADAVYLAGKSFGARAYADNFTEKEIIDALSTAHLFGVKIYLTANTLTRQSELPELISFVSQLYDAGLDGVIVQDLGVAAELQRHCPGLPLHASTQMSITGPDGVRFLKKQGFSRVVPARELSLSEIRELKKTDIEIETFIHGAMCYSYSGRCLMSSFLGGRSGNRGRCAGTCRLPYEILDEGGKRISLAEQDRKQRSTSGQKPGTYPLSMNDLCVLPILPDLMDAGIDSFKIEGRMKKAEYVAGVTVIYRKYIDRFYEWDESGRPERWQIEQTDLDTLYSLYIRTDLSTGYYHERNGRDMLTIGRPGYRGTKPELLQEIRSRYLDQPPRRPICGTATVQVGRPIALTVTTADELPAGAADSQKRREEDDGTEQKPAPHGCCKDQTVQVTGSQVQSAQQRPLTEENIRSKLTKTGDSPFYFEVLTIATDGRSFLPVSVLNDLRRRALEELQNKILKSYVRDTYRTMAVSEAEKQLEQALFSQKNSEPDGENGHMNRHFRFPERQLTAVMVLSEEQAYAALDAGVDILILDGPVRDHPDPILSAVFPEGLTAEKIPESQITLADVGTQTAVWAALPHVLRSSDEAWLEQYCKRFHRKFNGFLARTFEGVEFLNRRGYNTAVAADSSLYIWNRSAFHAIKPYCSWNVLPLELDRRELLTTFEDESCWSRLILPVYGRAPMMISSNCVRKTAGRCSRSNRTDFDTGEQNAGRSHSGEFPVSYGQSRSGESCFYRLADRRQAIFPVFTDCTHCQNVIYNSIAASLLNCIRDETDPLIHRVGALLLSFTTESRRDTEIVLRSFRHEFLHSADSCRSAVPDMGRNRNEESAHAVSSLPSSQYTYGHYRKGVN